MCKFESSTMKRLCNDQNLACVETNFILDIEKGTDVEQLIMLKAFSAQSWNKVEEPNILGEVLTRGESYVIEPVEVIVGRPSELTDASMPNELIKESTETAVTNESIEPRIRSLRKKSSMLP